jgi:hypothetical protein
MMKRLIIIFFTGMIPLTGNATITKANLPGLPEVKLDSNVTVALEGYLERSGHTPKLYSVKYVCKKKGRTTDCKIVALESEERITILSNDSNK